MYGAILDDPFVKVQNRTEQKLWLYFYSFIIGPGGCRSGHSLTPINLADRSSSLKPSYITTMGEDWLVETLANTKIGLTA